jgi:hypothetical protein
VIWQGRKHNGRWSWGTAKHKVGGEVGGWGGGGGFCQSWWIKDRIRNPNGAESLPSQVTAVTIKRDGLDSAALVWIFQGEAQYGFGID